MSFTDHKIAQFEHRISDLADQPNMPPDELKARFDACPEQLRVSLNAMCDEAARLDERVYGIVAGTFGDSIDKSMLSDELVTELNAKATQTELAEETAARKAETTARESADSALSTRVSSLESAMPQKAQAYFGTYTGNGEDSQFIRLGFTPKAVLVLCGGYATYSVSGQTHWYGGLAMSGYPVMATGSRTVLKIESNGFRVYMEDRQEFADYVNSNYTGLVYHYLAFR